MPFPSRHPFLGPPGSIAAFAHRGGSSERPENSLEAFKHAYSLGYRYLETDVQLTKDGVLVVAHDPVMDQVSNLHGAIGEMTYAEVREADIGYWFSTDGHKTFPWRKKGLHVLRLDELLSQFPDCKFNIDAKDDATVEPLVDLLRQMHAFDRVCVATFSDQRLARLRSFGGEGLCTSMGQISTWIFAGLASAAPRLNLLFPTTANCIQIKAGEGPVFSRACKNLVSGAHRMGLDVHVWVVDERENMNGLLELGVDGLMTDTPTLLRQVLVERKQWVEAPREGPGAQGLSAG
jgi:glycerophosphoryl diester phosphodiesterase